MKMIKIIMIIWVLDVQKVNSENSLIYILMLQQVEKLGHVKT